MKKFIYVFFLCCLCGCASTQKYEQYLKSTIGISETQLTEKVGIPDGSYEKDGIKYLIYQYNSVSSFNGMAIEYNCKTTFKVKDEHVIGAYYKGNHCVM